MSVSARGPEGTLPPTIRYLDNAVDGRQTMSGPVLKSAWPSDLPAPHQRARALLPAEEEDNCQPVEISMIRGAGTGFDEDLEGWIRAAQQMDTS